MLSIIQNIFSRENIRWVNPDNFHITLRFIGDTSDEMFMHVKKALDIAAKQISPFHFFISGIGVFRSISYPRVLWLEIKDSGSLQILKTKTDETLQHILKIDFQEMYQPHLTIGRMKKINDLKLLGDMLKEYKNQVFLRVNVEEIIFYESVLFSEGPVYRILSAHPLK